MDHPTRSAPTVPHDVELSDNERKITFTGRLLAVASSERLTHNHDHPYAPPGKTCSACRWVEVSIYRRDITVPVNELAHDHREDYVVYTVGRSVVPGEHNIPRIVETASPYEVVEALTVRRPPGGGRPAEVFMPPQHLRALSAAAQFDAGIRDAYVNRAVV